MKKKLQCSFRVIDLPLMCLLLICAPRHSFAQENEHNVFVSANRESNFPLVETSIPISLSEVGILEVFKSIEAKSDYHFVYDQSIIGKNHTISLTGSASSLKDMLGEISRQTNLRFKLINKLIYVKQENEVIQLVRSKEIITGKVIDQDGSPIPGVSVLIKGTNTGTITDQEGNYSLDVPDQNAILVFTYIGFTTQEISVGGRSKIELTLLENIESLGEVVVTALGIEIESRKLGYSATAVNPDLLTTNRSINVGNSLQGKIAGVNVSVPSSGPGGSSKIRIRGQSSFGGDNSPLIIVDGIPINNRAYSAGYSNPNPTGASSDGGDGLQSINPDNIASMTVLKGAAAAALYGFRAKDGAIIITTKTGTLNEGIGIEYNVNFQASNALDYTDFQYEYGQGEHGLRPTTVAEAQSSGVWSFGEKFDGQLTPQFDGSMQPYLPNKNRIKDYFRTGTEVTNSVALSGGNEKGTFRISFSDTEAKGIVPNSDYNKKILNLGLNYNFTPQFSTHVNLNYSNEDNHNPPQIGIERFGVNSSLYTMANSIDVDWLKNYMDANGNEMPLSRFTGRTNPYWAAYERFENIKRDRLFGNATLRYQFSEWLYVQGRVGQDYYTRPYEINQPTGSRVLGSAVTGFNGSYYQDVSTFRETNFDFLVGANKTLGRFGINAIVGGNQMQQVSDILSTQVSNFYVRDLYTIGNGQIKNPNYSYSQKRVNSIYGSAEISYNDYLFINVTGRNDWFSTLNPESNSYLYPSISSSFVFSDVFNALPSWLSFGKLRAAYAEVGSDTDPYVNTLYYSMSANPFNNSPLGSPNTSTSPNPNLRPLKVKESEIGLDLRLFDNLMQINFSAYQKFTEDEILNVDISIASGYNQTKVNVGRLKNEGVEMLLTLFPVNRQVTWETTFNTAYNKSKVLELAHGQESFDVGSGQWFGTMSHELGKSLASVRSFDYRRDANGNIVTSAGKPLLGDLITYGSAIPKWTGGWLNTVSYKGFRLFTQIDYKFGAVVLSNSNFNFLRHGLSKETLPGREGGVLFEGTVNADGSPNTTRVPAEDYYSAFRNLGEKFIYDASFVRLRSISLGYDLSPIVGNTFIKEMTVSAIANNVLMIKKYLDNVDPEAQDSVSDNLQGIDAHSLPTTRSLGVNLRVKF